MTYYIGDIPFCPTDELQHHGILGQKWGVRRYQNKDGSYTAEGKARYYNSDGSWTRQGRKQAGRDAKSLLRTARSRMPGKQGRIEAKANEYSNRYSEVDVEQIKTDGLYKKAKVKITNEAGESVDVEGRKKLNIGLSNTSIQKKEAKREEKDNTQISESSEKRSPDSVTKDAFNIAKVDSNKKDKSYGDLKKVWDAYSSMQGLPDMDSPAHPWRKRMYELSGNPDTEEGNGANFKKALEASYKLNSQYNDKAIKLKGKERAKAWEDYTEKNDRIFAEAIAKDLGYMPTEETINFFKSVMYAD